jgi:hypothetical protein
VRAAGGAMCNQSRAQSVSQRDAVSVATHQSAAVQRFHSAARESIPSSREAFVDSQTTPQYTQNRIGTLSNLAMIGQE